MSSEDMVRLRSEISPTAEQEVFFTYMKYGNLYRIFRQGNNDEMKPEDISPDIHILLLTGIASPKAITEKLR